MDALRERQVLLALLAQAAERAEPRPNQAQRGVSGDRPIWQRPEPPFHGRVVARDRVPVPVARDQKPRALVVLGPCGLPDRAIYVARALQPRARAPAQGRYQVGLGAPELVEQELGEEVVVAVPFSLFVQRNHE